MNNDRGFSLIELIMIIVLLGIGLTGLMAMFGRSTIGMADDAAIQTGTQLVQQCAEHILGQRRRHPGGTVAGYNSIDATSCNSLPAAPTGYSLAALVVTNPYAAGACAGLTTCQRIEISANGPTGVVARGDLILAGY